MMKHLIAPVLAALLVTIGSPLVMWHGCGLGSWPLEWSLVLVCCAGAFAIARSCKKKWSKVSAVIAAPALSFAITYGYQEWLHSESFPTVLLDQAGKDWHQRSHRGKEPIQPPKTTRGK
jgi:hypothetical protein